MLVDYQEIVNFIIQFMYVLAPIALIFVIVEIITNMFFSFVRGDRRIKL